MKRILIIDDEPLIRESLKEVLEYEGHEVVLAEDGAKGLKKIQKEKFNAIFCDIKMPKMDGMELLQKAKPLTDASFVMISGHATIENAVEAMKQGAFYFIEKPLDLNRILITLRNALEKEELVEKEKILLAQKEELTAQKEELAAQKDELFSETKNLKKQLDKKYHIVGSSKALLQVLEMSDTVAKTDARVLITGENGTGKELLARRIHEKSAVANGAFVAVNCAAIPSELIESELFGHEKGSFTSAIKQRKGSFEQANGGTLFLDEIADMSLSAQAKVLRALQENKIMRVGGESSIDVKVRVIAATNKDLKKEIEEGRFRQDLYHRISVVVLRLPALRERIEDIPELVKYFMEDVALSMGRQPLMLEKSAMELLQNYSWLGNIRELHNVVERLLIFNSGRITAENVKKFL
ncbi:MAG: sigma-54 dependent transcriptional regulator [Bacteroidales bacterium]|jgi:DNA-binding NtrC family response regulator|nr:sigma-54 dependent transcriptional regulator [Bacteroidales bacterium]